MIHGREMDEKHMYEDSREYDLAYLTSRPLVRITKANGQTKKQPIEELDFEAERDLLHSALSESGKEVRLRAEVATVSNLRTLVTLGCKALHYSGHGYEGKLAFEDRKGLMHSVTDEVLCDLVGAGERKHSKIQFVFVSACYSEDAGKAFARAGVPHVVAVKFDNAVSDIASRVFFQQFYLALLVGKTVRAAFDVGKAAVKSDAQVRDKDEAAIFLLLPAHSNHDVVIFNDLRRGKWRYISPRDQIINRIHARPENFIGREKETQVVYQSLIDKRMVIVWGDKGIGKTALVKNVAQYAYERASAMSLEGVFYISLDKDTLKQSDSILNQCCSMGYVCWYNMKSRHNPMQRCTSNRDFFDEMRDRKYLLILDGIDAFDSISPLPSEELNVILFLRELLDCCRSIRVVATSHKPVEYVHSKSIQIGSLTRRSSARLFLKFLGRGLTQLEHAEIDQYRDHLDGLANHRLLTLCDGNASVIAKAARMLRANKRLGEVHVMLQRELGRHMYGGSSHGVSSHGGSFADPIDPIPTFTQPSSPTVKSNDFWQKYISDNSDRANIKKLKQELRLYFERETRQSDRTLSNEDFRSIETQLQVNRGTVYRRKFGYFWPWFEAVTKIIAECKDLWTQNIIYGLIAKEEAHRLLRDEDDGVFLIRFSESRPNHVALAYKHGGVVTHTLVELTDHAFEIEVENSERFRYESLPDVIYNLNPLVKVLTRDMDYKNKEDLITRSSRSPSYFHSM